MNRKDKRHQRTQQRIEKARRHENGPNEEEFGQQPDDDMDEEDNENEEITVSDELKHILKNAKIYMWEFGQNDTKRDSGSKLCRLGYAKRLKVGQNFNGIVLSSEAKQVMSPEDAEIVAQYGIAGINCSWNRLEEIPFTNLGKARNQRKLPFLVAANTVNYGKVFKMNTAEAVAAALFISGAVHEAVALLYPFSYGEEFFKLNAEAFEQYVTATTEKEVVALSAGFERLKTMQALEKEQRRAEKAILQHAAGNVGHYINESLLPPRAPSDDEEEEPELENGLVEESATTLENDNLQES